MFVMSSRAKRPLFENMNKLRIHKKSSVLNRGNEECILFIIIKLSLHFIFNRTNSIYLVVVVLVFISFSKVRQIGRLIYIVYN